MSYLFKLNQINTFVFDVDGVMTDNTISCNTMGEMVRVMNILDGLGIKKAIEKKYVILIITGSSDDGVRKRLEYLGIEHIINKTFEKDKALIEFCKQNKINLKNTLYIGDDLPDINAMLLCGLKCCPKDARTEVKKISDFISSQKGGAGVVREMIEKVMKVQNNWI